MSKPDIHRFNPFHLFRRRIINGEKVPYELPSFDQTKLLKEPSHGENLNDIVVVMGATGSGKDFLVSQLDSRVEKLPSFGEILSDQLKVDRDQLRLMSQEEIERHYPAVVNSVLQHKNPIITCHPVYLNGTSWSSASTIYDMLRPKLIIAVTARPEKIRQWRAERNRDGRRNSVIDSISRIEEEQQRNILEMLLLAEKLGSGCAIVYNEESSIKANTNFVHNLITRYLPVNTPLAEKN